MNRLWVIDTNVVVSGLIYRDSLPGRIIDAGIAGHFDFAYDARILTEYRDVLWRPKFGFDSKLIREFLVALLDTPPLHWSGARVTLPDPSDAPFAEIALLTPERVIVTGNQRHFLPAERLGLIVLSPALALDLLTGKARRAHGTKPPPLCP